MARDLGPLNSFNRGIISPLALARLDVERVRMSAATQTNFMPRVLGSMMLRPGTEYVSETDSEAFFIPFVFSKDDTALIELSGGDTVRVWVNERHIIRASVSTAITNGGFETDLTGWTDADDAGATSAWSSTGGDGGSGGFMKLTGTGFASAIRRQTLTIAAEDQNVEHAINITVDSGPVRLRIGSTSGGEEYVTETELWTGYHSISFTPTGANVYLQFSSVRKHSSYIGSVSMNTGTTMVLTGPWAAADLPLLRWSQSADVVFIACQGYPEYRIERRSTTSWSIVRNEPEDGPWRSENLGPTSLTPSASTGDITLTASRNLFKSGHKGALFRIESVGQYVTQVASGANQWTNEIRVSGNGVTQRRFTITITGTWSGTVTLQRSVAEPGAWVDVTTYTGNTTVNYDDGLDDQIIYYRIGIDSGDYTSGSATLAMSYANGSITGVVRIKSVSSETSATAHVIQDLGGTAASPYWWESAWSDYRGWPSSLALFEGRLWHAGKSYMWGSVVDSYLSYDDDTEGDSGPISRSIGEGPIDSINWIVPMQRLVISTDTSERSAKASSLDDPLTPSSFTLKQISSQGSARISPIVLDDMGIFLQASKRRLYALRYNTDATISSDYAPEDLTALAPHIGSPSIVNLAYQKQPDTRIHAVRSDGTVAILVYDRLEDVKAWIEYETDGNVVQAIVLPGDEEDTVYYVVDRTEGRFLERWALESECQGGDLNKCLDSHVVYDGAATVNISGLSHLTGQTVRIWADGEYVGEQVVAGDTVELSTAASKVVVGLPYTGTFKSSKLAYASPQPLTQKKRVAQVGLILGPTHREAVKVGSDLNHMDALPLVESGVVVSSDWSDYDEVGVPINSAFDTDSRLCIQVDAPKHATILAAVVNVEVNEKTFS